MVTKEKRMIEIAEQDNKNSDDSTQSINRTQHDKRTIVSIVDMHDQQILPEATNLNTHLLIGNVRGEERPRKRPPSAPEIPRHQGPGVLKIEVVHKEERHLKTG